MSVSYVGLWHAKLWSFVAYDGCVNMSLKYVTNGVEVEVDDVTTGTDSFCLLQPNISRKESFQQIANG